MSYGASLLWQSPQLKEPSLLKLFLLITQRTKEVGNKKEQQKQPQNNEQNDNKYISSVQFSCSVVLTLCDPMDYSTPGLPVHHELPEFTQSHLHWVDDAIQPSHPLLSPSPPTFNLSQHQGLFQDQFFASRGQSIGVSASASVLPMNIQNWFCLGWTGWISLLSKGLSRVFSNTTVQKHQFFSTQLSSQSNAHIHTWPLEKP